MRRVLLVAAAAATARAQLTEFSSHIVLTGFDIENFNRPNRLAHIELFGCLGRVFFEGEWKPQNVGYFDRDTSRYAEAYGRSAGTTWGRRSLDFSKLSRYHGGAYHWRHVGGVAF